MVKSLSVMGITDSDFPMSSITGRANLLLTTSIGGGVHAGIKMGAFAGPHNRVIQAVKRAYLPQNAAFARCSFS
ncbi:hypothetical protein FMJ29_17490 [Klebsiella michiganensis]|nr:hypothetical protein [Klebsiella michiganensis]